MIVTNNTRILEWIVGLEDILVLSDWWLHTQPDSSCLLIRGEQKFQKDNVKYVRMYDDMLLITVFCVARKDFFYRS